MGDVQWITGPGRSEALAQELNSGLRTRPAAVVSIPSGAAGPWIDAERLAGELGDLADVFVLSNAQCSWAFATAMPSRTQVYGGAGRVYPVNLDWVHDPARSRLRFVYAADEGPAATTRLIEDGLAASLDGGAAAPRRGAVKAAEVTGVVLGCPTVSQAMVAVPGGYATIQVGLIVPGVSAERVFSDGMPVRGFLDEQARRLDVRAFLPDPATRLAELRDGDLILARVESVGSTSCRIAPYPGVAIRVPWSEVTASASDDLHDLMSVGETVAVRAIRAEDGVLSLSLIGFDEDDPESPETALAIFPGGPAWLLPPEPAVPARGQDPLAEEDPPAKGEPASTPAESSTPMVTGSEPARPTPGGPAGAPPPRQPPAGAPRPSPLLLAGPHPSHQVVAPTAAPGTPAPPGPGALNGGEALRTMSRQLQAARARALHLEAAAQAAEANLRSAQTEMQLLERDLAEQTRDLTAREADLRRLRARIRKNVQEERRVAAQREAAPGESLFLEPELQFRFDVTDRWARRIPAAEKADRPLRPFRFGPRFLESLVEIEGVDRPKVADVVVDVLTGLAENSTGRDMHPLRSGTGGDDDVLRREGYTCWRVAIQRRSPQARRLHFWRSADDIELSRVVLHDDYAP